MASLSPMRSASRSVELSATTPTSHLNVFMSIPKVLDAVYESGVTYWDSANVYGDNEELIGKW